MRQPDRYGRNPGVELRLSFLPLILLALPLVEIAVFVAVGSEIGVLATLGLVLATTILGAVLLRIQGLGAMAAIRASMEAREAPGRELVHGAMIMLAGLLLLLPGFVTDVLGLLLFVPPVREAAWSFLRKRIVVVDVAGGARRPGAGRRRDGRTIDLDEDDYSREGEPREWPDDEPPPPPPGLPPR